MKTIKCIILYFIMSYLMIPAVNSFAWWSVSETNDMDLNMVTSQYNFENSFYVGMDYGEDNLVPYGGGTGIADTDSFSCPTDTCYFDIVLTRDLPHSGSTIQFYFSVMNNTSTAWTDYHLEFWDSTFENKLMDVPLLSWNSNLFTSSSFSDSVLNFWSPSIQDPWMGDDIDFTMNVDQMPAQFGIRQVATVGSVVPEPISSILFVIGGGTLGFRHFRRKFKK